MVGYGDREQGLEVLVRLETDSGTMGFLKFNDDNIEDYDEIEVRILNLGMTCNVHAVRLQNKSRAHCLEVISHAIMHDPLAREATTSR